MAPGGSTASRQTGSVPGCAALQIAGTARGRSAAPVCDFHGGSTTGTSATDKASTASDKGTPTFTKSPKA